MSWTLNTETLETRPLPDDMHPGLSAVMLVREAMSEYVIPSSVDITYKGMKRLSGHGAHHLHDGVLTCTVGFRSLIGKKHEVDVPVIVHRGYMVFPEVFIDNGRIEVMAQSAFDEILSQASVRQKMQDRANMYSPHVMSIDLSAPKVQNGMFGVTASAPLAAAELPNLKEMVMGKQATHTPHGLDPAERDRSDRLHPSQVVKLTGDIEVRLRGGSHIVYPQGTEVMIVRDMTDEGLIYYCEFPDGRRAPVHYEHLPV